MFETSCVAVPGAVGEKDLEPRRGAWAKGSWVVLFLCGWLLKASETIQGGRQREVKQGHARAPRSSKSEEKKAYQ